MLKCERCAKCNTHGAVESVYCDWEEHQGKIVHFKCHQTVCMGLNGCGATYITDNQARENRKEFQRECLKKHSNEEV